MKISDAFDEFRKNEILALGRSNNTNEGYIYAEKKVIGFFGDINIENIDIDGVHGFYLAMIINLSKNTARQYICQLRTVLSYCKKRGIKTMNPDDIRTPNREKKVARFITCEEFNVFIREMNRSHHGYSNLNRFRNTLIANLLFVTGLRVSELCALNRDSIHDRQFSVVGKSKDPRPCYITKEVERDIEHYLAMRHDSNKALFVANQNGRRITPKNVQRIFRRVSVDSGIFSVTPHTLRHSYATRLIEDGVDIRYVATLLGHQSLETTQKYTHVRDNRLRKVYENVMEK